MKKLTPQPAVLAGLVLFAVTTYGQTTEQNVNVTIKPSQTVEQRVADEVKLAELRKAAAEKAAAEEAARIAETSPKAQLAKARIVYVQSDTDFFDSIQLQNELRKREEFDRWQMAIVDDWNKRNAADIVIEIDRPLFTYTFTYKITSRSSGILLSTGKLTAFDGNIAAPQLAARVIADMKLARGETKQKK
jgi:hypothetical protein